MDEKITAMEEKFNQLITLVGHKKVHAEVLNAEMLQHCQEAVNLRNEISKAKQYSSLPKPASFVSPNNDVPAPVIQEAPASV